MNIDASAGNIAHSATLVHLLRARAGAGRIVLPTSNTSNYTRLKHVQGVPSSIEGQGYSISKLRRLDAMIARLSRTDPATTHIPDENLSRTEALTKIGRLFQERLNLNRPHPFSAQEQTGLLFDQLV